MLICFYQSLSFLFLLVNFFSRIILILIRCIRTKFALAQFNEMIKMINRFIESSKSVSPLRSHPRISRCTLTFLDDVYRRRSPLTSQRPHRNFASSSMPPVIIVPDERPRRSRLLYLDR